MSNAFASNSVSNWEKLVFVVTATLAKFGLHSGNIKFHTQNEECVSMSITVCIILPMYFSISHVQLKCTDNNKNNL